MNHKLKKICLFLVVLAMVFACSAVAFAAEAEEVSPSNMYCTFWALVPPIIAIGLALITKEVYSSLFIGIVAGGLFYANFAPVTALDAIISDGLVMAIADSAGIFLFLVQLGIIVALLNRSGGSAAFGRWAAAHVKTRAGAMLATMALGILIFVDDYFNCLTVGGVMRPVTDMNKVSRAKLAYLIDATAAPVCMIAPISSWAAAVVGTVEEYNGFELFIRAIPYNYYSLLTFVFVIGIVLLNADYGPMKLHEMNARLNGDLFTSFPQKGSDDMEQNATGKVVDLVLPIVVLIVACVMALVYFGGYFEVGGEYYQDLFGAFTMTDVYTALPWGGMIALLFSFVYYILRGLKFKNAMEAIPAGFNAMVPAITILALATALKNMTGLLGADVYVYGLMYGAAEGLMNMLPAIIFLVAVGLSFATGTSWGTFGILIPIVTAVFPSDNTLMIIGISACLAGAVCGDHCSPISDTTIMSSAGSQCYHINHVSTQLPYALTVAAISFVCYVVAGIVQNAVIVLLFGIVLTLAVLFALKKIFNKKAAQA